VPFPSLLIIHPPQKHSETNFPVASVVFSAWGGFSNIHPDSLSNIYIYIFWAGTHVSEISGTSEDRPARIEQTQTHFELLVHFDVQV
jgi:hypothetical protein